MILDIPNVRMMNRILYNMRSYLHSTFLHENVYYLNKKGRELIGSQYEFKKNSRLEHHIMRNDIYIFYHYPRDWQIECPVTWIDDGKDYRLISDARFTYEGKLYFVEIDVQQKMIANRQKIKKYASLFRVILQEKIGKPVLLWYTVSEMRKRQLEIWCNEQRIVYEVLCKQRY